MIRADTDVGWARDCVSRNDEAFPWGEVARLCEVLESPVETVSSKLSRQELNPSDVGPCFLPTMFKLLICLALSSKAAISVLSGPR